MITGFRSVEPVEEYAVPEVGIVPGPHGL